MENKFLTLHVFNKTFKLIGIKRKYSYNNTLAIELVDNKTHEPFAILTVNLPDSLFNEGKDLPPYVQAVDTNNCWWAEDFIKENNLGTPLGISVPSGYCEYPLYSFDLSKLVEGEY